MVYNRKKMSEFELCVSAFWQRMVRMEIMVHTNIRFGYKSYIVRRNFFPILVVSGLVLQVTLI